MMFSDVNSYKASSTTGYCYDPQKIVVAQLTPDVPFPICMLS